ncbi:MAG: 4a-hydroxytetrahydrobiopterin dehydratase [Paracoccus sp. (in: a-proteobacteria)]|nr:4a-hydroxytetrahydrobiopterin dehydratase [Paracoccus sp. (in: a-proteobacteria)]
MDKLDAIPEGWALNEDATAITRDWKTRNFAQAQAIAMLAGAVAEHLNHHPDIAYGWGYVRVTFTSHDAGGLTARDIDGACRINAALA